ncbi:hypothetical protein J132_05067 [Termitomyces sp. J132]|nr:hypothetical protein J132_05067 [Termitomyces sp. J132]
MAPRIFSSPSTATKPTNRLSAVYIGPVPTHIDIPDLPEPPSSSGSSEGDAEGSGSASGLPSPPATNSTGSGGDEKEKENPSSSPSQAQGPPPTAAHIGRARGHKPTSSTSSVASISISSVVVPRGASIMEETMPDEGDDDTARLDTLQRVKRNRLVLDKLSISGTHSPAPSSSSSSSRRSHSQTHTSPLSLSSSSNSYNDPRSGSETERESTYSRASSAHHHRAFSLASAPAHTTSTPQHPDDSQPQPQTHHSRVPSAPGSTSRTGSGSGSGSSGRRRTRLALLEDGTSTARLKVRERAEEILEGTRKRDSPSTSGGRRRGALPAEFRRTSTEDQDPATPLRAPSLTHTTSNSSSASASTSASRSKGNKSRYSFDLTSQSSSRSSHSRSSYSHTHSQSYSSSSQSHPNTPNQVTNHTPNHNHNLNHAPSYSILPTPAPRPQSSDPRTTVFPSSSSIASASASRRAAGTPILGMTAYRERRQTLRGGSAESALSGGANLGLVSGPGKRTLIGEELRAAGLSPSRSRVGRGVRMSLGWEGEEEAGEAKRAVTSMALYVDGEGEKGKRREISLVRNGDEWEERERRREERAREREREREMRERERSLSRATRETEMRERDRSLSRAREDHEYRPLSRANEDRDLVTPDRERERDTTYTISASTSTALTRLRTATGAATPSPYGTRRHASAPVNINYTEHTRLLGESLGMFEGHFARLPGIGNAASTTSTTGGDVVKNAQSVVGAAVRLNEFLRLGSTRALEEQVRAEVEGVDRGAGGGGKEEQVWGRVGAEYREGLRVSDELVRGLTGLLLGFGRVTREFGAAAAAGGAGEATQHMRSVSLDEEGLVGRMARGRRRGSMSPDVGSSGSGGGGISALVGNGRLGPGSGGTNSVSGGANSVSGSGRRSVESRRSWDAAATLGLREDVVRRLGTASRAESALGGAGAVSRPSTAFSTLRERERVAETPPQQQAQAQTQKGVVPGSSGSGSGTTRRLFTPREQREMQMSVGGNHTPGIRALAYACVSRHHDDDNDYHVGQEPDAPVIGDYEAFTARNDFEEEQSRKVCYGGYEYAVRTSASTSANGSTTFPVTAPAAATTAVTPHTVSTQTPERTAFPSLPRTNSDRSVRSSVTFSRPSTVSSVSALVDVRQQDTRRRTASGGVDPSMSDPLPPTSSTRVSPERQREREVQSGSETERPPRKTQIGKMMLDARGKGTGTGSAQDRSAVVAANAIVAAKLGITGGRGPPVGVLNKDRRRTVTDIWPRE